MSIQALAKEFVDLCNQGKNFDVMKSMYADNIVSVESEGKQTAGKTAVIEKSAKWASGLELHGETVRGPFFHGANKFAVTFVFEVTPKATGQRVKQEEVGVYTVENGKIVREEFFNQGNW
jgi:hypothetical protein